MTDTPTANRIRNMYSWAYAWRTEDGEDDTDLIGLRASNRAEFDAWLADHDRELAATIATRIRRNCTPSSDAYDKGGDVLILAVAEWITNPPEWVDAPWRTVVGSTPEGQKDA